MSWVALAAILVGAVMGEILGTRKPAVLGENKMKTDKSLVKHIVIT